MSKQKSTTTSKKSSSKQIEDGCCICGEESDVGCHGYKSGQIYDIYYCNSHYHAQTGRAAPKEVVEEPEEDEVEVPTANVKREKTDDKDIVHRRPAPKSNKVRVKQDVSDLVKYYTDFYQARLDSKLGGHV